MIILPRKVREKECRLCGARSKNISEEIGVCVNCLREKPEEALEIAERAHHESRARWGLPPKPPRTSGGIRCGLCDADCIIGEGEAGYCGLRKNVGGRLESRVNSEHALLHYYLDAHVTNCLPGGAAIMLHDGSWARIGDVVEKPGGGESTLSFYGWRFKREKISGRHRFRFEGKLIRIRTETGLELEMTADHRILTDREIPAYIPASELKPGDKIFTFIRRSSHNNARRPVRIAEYLPEEISIYDQDVKDLIRQALSSTDENRIPRHRDRIRGALSSRKRGIRLALLRELCRIFSIDWNAMLNRISIVGYKRRIILKERELKPEHMYLLGLLYSDGHVKKKTNTITFTNSSKKLLKHVQALYEDLFGNTRLRTYSRGTGLKKGRKKCIYTRKRVVLEASNPVMKGLYENLLLNYLGLPFNLGWLGEDLLAGLLAGMLDGDGHVSLANGRTEIGFVLKDKMHAEMFLLLLRSLGVVGRLCAVDGGKIYRVIVRSSKSCERLCKLLIPYSILKREKLKTLLKRVSAKERRTGLDERLPLFFSTVLRELRARHEIPKSMISNPVTLRRYENFSRNPCIGQACVIVEKLSERVGADLLLEGLKTLIDCELIPERIVEVRYVEYRGYVYDITLREAHNFLANGILVKNCCAAWFCPAGTGCGYPVYAVRDGPEYGYYNLALFFYGCSFDCLFCQNWSHKRLREGRLVSADELVEHTLGDYRITCWCWFGGSPEPQLPFAINASRRILEEKPERRIVRICFEWNGCGAPELVRRAGELAYMSGGNIKFDLKAYTPSVHRALTGRDNKRVLENFELIYREFYDRRRGVPVLNATTLLVPHYVDEYEVSRIAEFIASLDPEIPYSLLIFHPDYLMSDLTITPRRQVERCYQAAKKYLKRVNIGNIALLGLAESEL